MKRFYPVFAASLSVSVAAALLLPPINAEQKFALQFKDKIAEKVAVKADDSTTKTGGATPVAVPTASRKLSDTIQFHMPGGDVLVGKMLAKQITVATEFGTLTIPTSQIRSFVPGLSSRPELLKEIEDLIAKLGSDDSAERDRAHKDLAALGDDDGHKVEGELRRNKGDANADRAKHISTLLSEFEKKQTAAEQLGEGVTQVWVREDTVVTTDFTVVGKISPTTFQINTQYGTLTVALAKIDHAVRAGQGREEFTKIVDVSGQHLMQRGYKKSTIQVQQGDQVSVTASGQITMSPWGSSTRSTPDGSNNWGQYQGFPAGCLVAKIGNNGKPFRVGSNLKFKAKKSGTIYFGIAMSSGQASSAFPGSYKVKTKVTPVKQ
ncbi:MAG: hypothetical protein IID44_01785 [Planctomycetes bacterium]|nr:hypothetical protein [Planctomycetota bacterium]